MNLQFPEIICNNLHKTVEGLSSLITVWLLIVIVKQLMEGER
jgi:hypothetical protein